MIGGIVALILAPIILVTIAGQVYWPLEANWDPLVGDIRHRKLWSFWGGPAEMKPCCFASGTPQSTVEKQLARHDWTPLKPDEYGSHLLGADYLSLGGTTYHRTASTLPCIDEFFLTVWIVDGTVEKSEGTYINAVCL